MNSAIFSSRAKEETIASLDTDSISCSISTPTSEEISPAAQKLIEGKKRFTDYISPDGWREIREEVKARLIDDSNKAREELLKSVEEKTIAGCRVQELIPRKYNGESKVVVYFHGGAFVLGDPLCQLHLPAPLADRTGWKVIAVDYPLAPYESDIPHPAHTEAFNVYLVLLDQYEASDIALFGDSAGGNIIFGLAQMLRDAKEAGKKTPNGNEIDLPGALLAYAPWVDIEQETPAYDNQERINQTLTLTPTSLKSARDAAFGNTGPYSTYINPIKGDYRGFESVSVAVYSAGRDILVEENEILVNNLKRKVKRVDYHCYKGMWHNFQQHFGLKESEQCADRGAEFLKESLK